MKYVKMLGLAAIVAAAMMAIVGTGTASATALCANGTSDPCTAKYPVGTELHAVLQAGTKATLKPETELVTTTCEESTVLSKLTGAGSKTTTVTATNTALTFGKCNNTVKVIAPGSLELHWISGTKNGNLTATGFEVEVVASLVKCVYAGSITSGLTLTGGVITPGNKATLDVVNAKVPLKTGFEALCGKTGIWNGSYEVTSPSPLYVTES
jgi:hypothetical protein